MDEAKARRQIIEILKAYDAEAQKHGWNCYGFKVTHALQKKVWPTWKHCLETVWKDFVYVTSYRDIAGIIDSTKRDPKWTAQMITNSWINSLPALRYISDNGGVVFYYPKTWCSKAVQRKVEILGMKWNPEADYLFDNRRVRSSEKNGI
jgi:hypothetical protein